MGIDNNATVTMGNFDSPPERTGGKLKWIFGGCGCLGLMTVLCFGGVVWFGLSKIDEVRREAKSFIESSSVAKQNLGTPVAIDGETLGTTPGQGPMFVFDVSGPKASGTVTCVSEQSGDSVDFVISSYTLEVNGEEFDLNQEDELGIDIDGLDEF